MMYSVFDVAGVIASKSGWTLSNLSLQKLVYLAQMLHLGTQDEPFFTEDFEAWDYGPVVPSLYHDLKMFGSDHVASYSSLRERDFDSTEDQEIIKTLVDLGKNKRPGQLVAIAHWEKGAWATNYAKHIRGIVIPKSEIKKEYSDRVESAARKAA